MRIECRDDVDDPFAIGRFDAVELGLAEPAPGWIDVDPTQRTDPRFLLEHGRDERSEFTTHAAHQEPLPAHPSTLPVVHRLVISENSTWTAAVGSIWPPLVDISGDGAAVAATAAFAIVIGRVPGSGGTRMA